MVGGVRFLPSYQRLALNWDLALVTRHRAEWGKRRQETRRSPGRGPPFSESQRLSVVPRLTVSGPPRRGSELPAETHRGFEGLKKVLPLKPMKQPWARGGS